MKGNWLVLVENLNGLNAWCKATVLRLKCRASSDCAAPRAGAVSLAHAELESLNALFRGDAYY